MKNSTLLCDKATINGGVHLIRFSCELVDLGWIEAKLSNDVIEKYIAASYISDALRDFISAVISIVNGSKNASCNWQEEPGQFRFVFTSKDTLLTLKIINFNKSFSEKDDHNGDLVFEGTENLNSFAKNIKHEYDRLLYELGEEGYKNIWNYEFPLYELNCLKLAIIEHQLKN